MGFLHIIHWAIYFFQLFSAYISLHWFEPLKQGEKTIFVLLNLCSLNTDQCLANSTVVPYLFPFRSIHSFYSSLDKNTERIANYIPLSPNIKYQLTTEYKNKSRLFQVCKDCRTKGNDIFIHLLLFLIVLFLKCCCLNITRNNISCHIVVIAWLMVIDAGFIIQSNSYYTWCVWAGWPTLYRCKKVWRIVIFLDINVNSIRKWNVQILCQTAIWVHVIIVNVWTLRHFIYYAWCDWRCSSFYFNHTRRTRGTFVVCFVFISENFVIWIWWWAASIWTGFGNFFATQY